MKVDDAKLTTLLTQREEAGVRDFPTVREIDALNEMGSRNMRDDARVR